MNLLLSILSSAPSIIMEDISVAPTQAVQQIDNTLQTIEATTEATGGLFSGGIGGTIGFVVYIVAIITLFYFLAIRPSKKKEKELKTMQDSIKVGDYIMTSSGFYGTVVEGGDDTIVVEFGTNRGVRIPVKKSEVYGTSSANNTGTN